MPLLPLPITSQSAINRVESETERSVVINWRSTSCRSTQRWELLEFV